LNPGWDKKSQGITKNASILSLQMQGGMTRTEARQIAAQVLAIKKDTL
jgi:hypothetical protein